MAQCVVVADDLTGGNATGVLMSRMEYSACTIMNDQSFDKEMAKETDCLIYPTDSRAIDPEEAYRRVSHACRLMMGDQVKVYGHRIDSTLRGNHGRETDAMLDCLGEDTVAIVAPAFPSSGRTVVGGYLLVEGIPVNRTNIAIDPKTPVKTADVAEIFRKQSHYPVAKVTLSEMMDGKHALAGRIRELVGSGARTITFDCVTQEDLDLIADAVITSGIHCVCVDPGVFTATMTRKMIQPYAKRKKNRILAVVGSVNPNTTSQMEHLWLVQHPIFNCFVKTRELVEGPEAREAEIARVVHEITEKADKNTVLTVTGDGIYPENRIDFKPYMEKYGKSLDEVTGMINEGFAEIAERIVRQVPEIQGMYTSGGDVTQAICRRFGAAGLDLLDEVLPLAAYGTFIKGDFDGMQIVTKGGSQGQSDAINRCINYLKERMHI